MGRGLLNVFSFPFFSFFFVFMHVGQEKQCLYSNTGLFSLPEIVQDQKHKDGRFIEC